MKLLTSPWGIALVAALAYIGTSTLVVMRGLTHKEEPVIPPTERPPKIWSFKTEAVDQLIAELKDERAKFTEEQKGIETMRAQLTSERAELTHVRDEIKTLRDELDQRVVKIEETDLKNLKTLANQYSAMKPATTVSIFKEMDEDMVVRIIGTMKADKITAILEEMAKVREKPGEEAAARRIVRLMDKLRLLQAPKKEAS